MSGNGVSPGEVGGVFAGAVAGLIALGHGVQWLLGWRERREESRSAKLQIWHDELDAREKALDDRIEKRLTDLETQSERRERESRALRIAFDLVAEALRQIDPVNPALRHAEHLLNAAFPLDPSIPRDMAVSLTKLDGRP